LEGIEVKRHAVLAQDPAENDNDREDEKSDLHTGTNSNTDRQVHLVLDGDSDSSGVLGSVTDNGQEDQTDEGGGDTSSGSKTVNAVNHELGTEGDKRRGDGERNKSTTERFGVSNSSSSWLSA
jgi:hypothetical protein